MGLTKEESRRREALRRQRRTRALKRLVVGSAVLVVPLLAYLAGQG